MNVSDLPSKLGLKTQLAVRLPAEGSLFARRFEQNVPPDERSWLGRRLEIFRRDRDVYLGQLESGEFVLKCRTTPLGAAVGRIPVQGKVRQVGALTVLEGTIDGFHPWKVWAIANAVLVLIFCVVLAATAPDWALKGIVFLAFLPAAALYLVLTSGFLYFVVSREVSRIKSELEREIVAWVR